MAPAALAWLDDLMTLLYLTECSLSLVGEAFWFLRRSQAPLVDAVVGGAGLG